MKKEALPHDKLNLFIPISVIFLLFIGIIISVIQVQHQQDQRSRAIHNITPPIANDCTVDPLKLTPSSNETALLTKVNEYRAQKGLSSLTWNNELQKAAVWLSNDNMVNAKLSHTDSLGRSTSKRIADCGFANAVKVAENINAGTSVPNTVLEAWKRSSVYNANLLDPSYTRVGISEANTGSASYWTLTLGSDLSTTQFPTVTIALSPSVMLSITSAPSPTVTSQPSQPIKTPVPTKRFTPTKTVIPSPTVDPRYVPNANDTQVWLAVKLRGIGIGGNLAPRNSSRKITVSIFDEENEKIKTGTGFVTFDNNDLFTGVVHLGKIPNGTYYIKVASSYTLQQLILPQFQVLQNDRLNVLPPILLIEGDFNEDNVISIDDYNVALKCFQDKKCSVQPFPDGQNPDDQQLPHDLLDLNDDGKVDVYDYNLLLNIFWQQRGD